MEEIVMEELTRDEQVEHWVKLRAQIKELQIEAAEYEQSIVELAEEKTWLVERVGLVEVRPGGRKTTWDTDLLWSAAVEHGRTHRALNPDTGDVASEAEAVGSTLRSMFGKTPNVTRGGVEAAGLEPSRFCETGAPGRSTISVKGGGS